MKLILYASIVSSEELNIFFLISQVWVREKDEDEFTKLNAQRTRNGTYPLGSQWTKNPLIPPETREHGYIKDMVNVPSNIEPGEYVLSFRWDCELSSQVWSMCASIFIE